MWFESKDAPESLESIISKQLCESGPEFIYLLENPLPTELLEDIKEEVDEVVIEEETAEEEEEVVEEE